MAWNTSSAFCHSRFLAHMDSMEVNAAAWGWKAAFAITLAISPVPAWHMSGCEGWQLWRWNEAVSAKRSALELEATYLRLA